MEWAYGRNRSEVTQNADAALLGRRVVAVPEYTSTLHARWMPRSDITVHGVLRHVGRGRQRARCEWRDRSGIPYFLTNNSYRLLENHCETVIPFK